MNYYALYRRKPVAKPKRYRRPRPEAWVYKVRWCRVFAHRTKVRAYTDYFMEKEDADKFYDEAYNNPKMLYAELLSADATYHRFFTRYAMRVNKQFEVGEILREYP